MSIFEYNEEKEMALIRQAEIEEDSTLIHEIYQIAQLFAPEYDNDKIYKCVIEKKNN